jgi:hypothetical protein
MLPQPDDAPRLVLIPASCKSNAHRKLTSGFVPQKNNFFFECRRSAHKRLTPLIQCVRETLETAVERQKFHLCCSAEIVSYTGCRPVSCKQPLPVKESTSLEKKKRLVNPARCRFVQYDAFSSLVFNAW